MPVWMTLVAIILSIPLMLVGLRVLGETNWGPISALSNMMQAVFGVIAPGQVLPNMVASGVTGTIASESEGLMQVYRTGEMMGSKPRFLTYTHGPSYGDPLLFYLVLSFSARSVGGALTGSEEGRETMVAPLDQLPPLKWTSQRAAIEALRASMR